MQTQYLLPIEPRQQERINIPDYSVFFESCAAHIHQK
jgi:hypothetical protein